MEFVLIGRGERVAPRLRQVTEHKLGRLGRIEPRITRVEVEVITASPTVPTPRRRTWSRRSTRWRSGSSGRSVTTMNVGWLGGMRVPVA